MILLRHEIAEMVATVTCIALFFIKRATLNTRLLPLLVLTLTMELVAKFNPNPAWKYLLYNIFTLIECLWFVSVIYLLMLRVAYRRVVLILSAILLAFGLVNLFAGQGLFKYNSITRLANSLVIIGSCMLLLWEMMVGSDSKARLGMQIITIYVAAIFFFYGGNFVLYMIYPLMAKKYPHDSVTLYTVINHNLNVALYGLIALALWVEFTVNKGRTLFWRNIMD